ncbi:MAG TPA: type 1 glutamine amidotransferase [Steroidobacteraceae bacterium]|jgi:GMP synthase (glutamine-hydrolysing)|nr:type 1 glutamine amidotransferase [Steroidobacteraceae bacterium]
MTRILVIDGNEAATRAKHVSVGGTDSGEGYAATLKRLQADLEIDIVRPADGEIELPEGVALADYDGAAFTGSALNVYSRESAVERQIELAKAVFAAGVPSFGSCWGLQVGVTAAGGSVIRNPRGREFGFGRRIVLNAHGRDHAMFQGKPEVFDAVTVHVDTVDSLPAGSTPLAHNDMGLQAAEIRFKNGASFWGVQYHPEYSCAEAAAMARRYGEVLIRDGLVRDQADLDALVADLTTLDANPGDARLAWRFGVGESITNPDVKLAELRNWLTQRVLG